MRYSSLDYRFPCAALLAVDLLLLVANVTAAAAGVTCPSGSGLVVNLISGNLSAAFYANGEGKTYQLDAGDYIIDPRIILNNPTTTCFIGTSPGQVVVNAADNFGFLVASTDAMLSLQGLTLAGTHAKFPGIGVRVVGGSVDINNAVLQNFNYSALYAQSSAVQDVRLTSVAFNNNGIGSGTAVASIHIGNMSQAWHEVEFSDNNGLALALYSTLHGLYNISTSLNISGKAVFAGNIGGAVYANLGVQLTFTGDAEFLGNTVSSSGAAILLNNGASATFAGSLLIQGNVAGGSGGAIAMYDGTKLVASGPTYLLNNHARSSNASAVTGGALFMSTSAGNAVATFSGPLVVQGNTAGGSGGAFCLSSVGSVGKSVVTIAAKAEFSNNTATYTNLTYEAVGGAVAVGAGGLLEVTTSGSICIQGNTATVGGGGIWSIGPVLLNGDINKQVMDSNYPEDVLIASTNASFVCPNSVLNAGRYYITGPICACARANNSNSSCTCPFGNLWVADACSCKIINQCDNVNGTGVPYQCSGHWVYNTAAANNTELTPSSCCLWAATCQTGYIDSYRACERGVYNSSASNQLSPSLYTCCQASCADSNIRSSQPSSWNCSRGTYDLSKALTAKPSNSVCCQPTCGDSNMSSPTPVHFNCTGPWQFNPLSVNVTALSNETCCTLVEAKLAVSVKLAISAPVAAVGDSVDLTINVAVTGLAAAVAVQGIVTVAIPNGLSVLAASLPAGCATQVSTVVCSIGDLEVGKDKSIIVRAAAAAPGVYTVETTVSSPSSVANPGGAQTSAGITVQGACCSNATGLCQAMATAAGCAGGSFLQDKSCVTAACPAPPSEPANVTITRIRPADPQDIAVGDVVDVELMVGTSNAGAKAVRAQVTVTGRLKFTGTTTVGTRAAECKVADALAPKNKNTGVAQRLSCTFGSMQKGQIISLKFSVSVLEAGAATIRSRVASATSANQEVFSFTARGACCLSISTMPPFCSDMTAASCKAAGGKASIKQSCSQTAC